MKLTLRIGIMLVLVYAVSAVFAQDMAPGFKPVVPLSVEVVNTYPHDANAFTQGLLWYEGSLYESTGRRDQSTLREVDPISGEVLRSIPVTRPDEQLTGDNPQPNYFAEGLELVDGHLIQLTWTEGEAFIYDRESFERLDTISYTGEGWGICTDGRYYYVSDSTQYLAIRELDTFELIGRILVTFNGQPLQAGLLNELECVGDVIYANLWQTDFVVQIDKYNGNIIGLIDASTLLTEEQMAQLAGASVAADGTLMRSRDAVLNGIAYNPESETFFITGKLWPFMFEVRFVPTSGDTPQG